MSVCSHSKNLRLPSASTKIFKDECTLCFDNQDMDDGIDVCLSCHNGSCNTAASKAQNHSQLHYQKTGHSVVLNIKRTRKVDSDMRIPPQKITKLAIEAEKDEKEIYNFQTSLKCFHCGALDPVEAHLKDIVNAVMNALSAKKQADVKAWEEEIKPCAHTTNLVQGEAKELQTQEKSQCNNCDVNENLWLCLTCGNKGCGRAQYGGVGGNGHGVEHFQSTGHPVSVKLGTITPEGTADIYCYLCDEERVDPNLSLHLKNFGIQLESQQKTEKSLAELQLDQNLKFDFSMTTEDGKELAPIFGPGLTGLKNLGNSCYMASVLQVLFSVENFKTRYTTGMEDHVRQCRDTPSTCFHCQMHKIATGLHSGRYSHPFISETAETRGQDGISPSMFKQLIGRDHHEFSSMRQQDAQEFLQHVLKVVEQKERAFGQNPATSFDFKMESRLCCLQCEGVRYGSNSESLLQLPVNATKLGVTDDGKDVYAPASFVECMKAFLQDDIREFNCPTCKEITPSTYNVKFKTFPEVLVCTMNRFIIGENYIMKKLTADINVPLSISLDQHRGHGKQEHERSFPESDNSGNGGHKFDGEALNQLLGMGFPDNRCKRALIATEQGGMQSAEIAMSWLFEHMEDPDIDMPLETSAVKSSGDFSETDIHMLCDMGFTVDQAKRGLKETGNNVERAVDWLFSHADNMPAETQSVNASVPEDTKPANYDLLGFVSHRGTSTGCGHYVCHVKKDNVWVLFNDNKVVRVDDISSHIKEGYIYVYKRV